MALRVATLGATDLRLGAAIVKPNYAAGRTIGGTAGRVMGHWRAMMVRLPSPGFTNNTTYAMMGASVDANFTAGEDTVLRIGGDHASQAANRVRPIVRYRGGAVDAFAGTTGAEGAFTSIPQMPLSPAVMLIIEGVRNVGTNAAPVWKGWGAACRIGTGTPASHIAATDIASAWISNTTGTLLRQVFAAQGTGGARTPVGVAIEQVALVAGDFPWDTANNRPHHDAIAALAGVGSNPFLTYADLVAAQNAGTLPYANIDQGRGNLDYHWTLRTLAAGLANIGTAGTATLAQTDWNSLTGGLVDDGDIAPAHWYSSGGVADPAITNPAVRFIGGRGTRTASVAGTRAAGQTVERRWERMSDNAALAGLDWATVATQSGTSFTVADVLPIGGPYRLRVRYVALPAQATSSDDWLAGTILATHGQSGMELSLFNGTPPGANNLALAVAAGAQGVFLKLNNQTGGTAATYAQPVMTQTRLIGGQTPACGSGAVAMLNEWQVHNPGHPLLICNMAINGTAQVDWANDTTINGGHASWTFLGSIGSVAGPSSGNGSGVVEAYAAAAGRVADLHLFMWTPNIATDPVVRAAYVAAIDARFSNAGAAPWVIYPPWRGHREPPDLSATVQTRQNHVTFVAELGARGILGPYWADVVMDGNPNPASAGGTGSLHAANMGTPSVTAGLVSDQNQVGQTRLARGHGRTAAWVFDRTIKAHGARVLAAWYRDGARTVIEVELGRQVRTLNGAGISNQFWISTDNGATWAQSGFTLALSADGTRAVLTSTGAAWAASNVRVDYARLWPFGPSLNADETLAERLLDGILYDNQTHRGGTDLAAGLRPGNPLQGTNRTGTGAAGVAVAARGAARLVANGERWVGSRNVTVRMMAADGVTVLRERTLAVTAS